MVMSLGRLFVGEESSLGSVYALGNYNHFEQGVDISGYLKAAAEVDTTAIHVELGSLFAVSREVEQFSFSFGTSLGDVAADQALASPSSKDVLPGMYSNLNVPSGSLRRLHSGSYRIGALIVEEGGILELDNSTGPVVLWIDNEVVVRGSLQEYLLEPNVLVVYAGDGSPLLKTAFRGTLIAPRAELIVPRTEQAHVGAFFARSIRVEDGASIEHRPFVQTAVTPSPIPAACDACLARARVASRICCDTANRGLDPSRTSRALCLASCADELDHRDECRLDCDATAFLLRSNAISSLSACMLDARRALGACIGGRNLRPDTCARMGYPLPPDRVDCAL
jgi:hypothetical protein